MRGAWEDSAQARQGTGGLDERRATKEGCTGVMWHRGGCTGVRQGTGEVCGGEAAQGWVGGNEAKHRKAATGGMLGPNKHKAQRGGDETGLLSAHH